MPLNLLPIPISACVLVFLATGEDHVAKFLADNGQGIVGGCFAAILLLLNSFVAQRKQDREWENSRRERKELGAQMLKAEADRQQIANDLKNHNTQVTAKLDTIESTRQTAASELRYQNSEVNSKLASLTEKTEHIEAIQKGSETTVKVSIAKEAVPELLTLASKAAD